MKLISAATFLLLLSFSNVKAKDCYNKKSTSKLFCYYGKAKDVNTCKCSHIILPANSDVKSIDGLRDKLGAAKILLTVNDFNEGLVNTMKSTKIDGLEINLKKLDSKNDISDFISTVRTKLGSDLYLAISVPSKTETLAKYYDFKSLSKNADVFILQTHFLGASKNVTFHPSRLSGLWDVQNTDSMVDLVSGLGAPLSKLVISAPVQAFKFTLQNEEYTAPGSPALELSTLSRNELCEKMGSDKWTLERDQDQAGPYIFRKKEWISFDDETSMDIKAKYSRVRGLAGIALKDLSQDGGNECGETLLESAFKGLSKQARAPRAAVLQSLEREILENPIRPLDNVQVSPYRISRVIDVEGKVHVIRQDTRTEFQCSRQGYFVHPRSCGRFYRCVKFDQLSDEFSVFEFDCPAGLAFDERVEVCVWPGSLPHASACSGSSEIAPVPKERFVCPGEQGYYADPENCRWFFACLDHGKSPLSAYEFRCPFGLVFDQDRLLCEWPWLVPKCGSGLAVGGAIYGDEYNYGQEGRSGDFELELYDGLGSLRGVKLGGLKGPFEKTVSKTYHGYGGANNNLIQESDGVNYQIGLDAGGVSNEAIGFGGKIEGVNSGASSYQSVESLNIGSGIEGGRGAFKLGTNINSELGEGTSSAFLHSGLESGINVGTLQSGFSTGGTNIEGTAFKTGSEETYGVYSGGFQQHQFSASGQSALNSDNLQIHGEKFDSGSFISQDQIKIHQLNSEGNAGTIFSTVQPSGSYSAGTTIGLEGISLVNNAAEFGAKSNSYSYSKHNQENSENIDIVAGGYSGIQSGIEISQHGVNLGQIESVTPVSITSTSIPSVTSVPIPSSTGFEIYNGGVVANIPDLQYKLESPSTINTHLGTYGNYKNLLTGFSTTIKPYRLKQKSSYVQPLKPIGNLRPAAVETTYTNQKAIFQGYDYSKPKIQFEDGIKPINPAVMSTYTYQNAYNSAEFGKANSYQEVNVKNNGGYYYNKPEIHFEEGYHYQKPLIKFEENPIVLPTIKYENKPIVHKPALAFQEVQIQNSQPVEEIHAIKYQPGYHYEKPTIKFEETPVIYQQPEVLVQEKVIQPTLNYAKGYHYEKPAITFEEKPAFTYQQVNVHHKPSKVIHAIEEKPLVIEEKPVQTYHYEKPAIKFENKHAVAYQEVKHEGYHYEKPTIAFEEKPVTYQHVHVHQPKLIQPIQKPAVAYHEIKQEGYHYEKPVVKFEEKPFVVEHKPAVTYQEIKHEGYQYEKPAVAFEEKPVVLEHKPAVTYQQVHVHQPVVEHKVIEQKPVVLEHKPTVTYQNIEQEGYHYEKPAVVFEEKPAVPAVTYQQINVHHQPVVEQKVIKQKPFVVEHNYQGYHYEKPAVVFEEKPVVPAVTYQQVNLHHQQKVFEQKPLVVEHKPAITYHERYHYEKPVIKYEEKPLVVNKPAVTYQEVNVHHQPIFEQKVIEHKPAVTYQTIKQEGYQYEKPTVVFEEKPAVTYQQINVHHQQKVIQENPVYHQEIKHEGYHYEKPSVVFEEKPVEPQVTYHQVNIQKPVHTYSEGYHYEKPAVKFEERPFVVQQKPAVTYQQIHLQHQKPLEPVLPAVTYFERKPSYKEVLTQPKTVVSSFSIHQPAPKPTQTYIPVQTYLPAPKPKVTFHATPTPAYIVPPQPSPTYIPAPQPAAAYIPAQTVTYQSTPKPTILTYHEVPKPTTSYIPAPKITTTQKPDFGEYLGDKQIYEEPIVVKKVQKTYYSGYNYPKPAIKFEEYSTPKPTFASIITKIEPVPLKEYQYYKYDSNQKVSTTESYIEPITQSRPIARYEFSSFDSQYNNYVEEPKVTLISSTPKPTELYINVPDREYLPQSTRRPSKRPSRVKIVTTTENYFEVPTKEYLPVTEIFKIKSTPVPSREYLPVTTVRPKVQRTRKPPTREYLPVSTTSPPNREYLPAKEIENYQIEDTYISTRRPKVVKITKSKKIVKVNDFHPILSAKLGAQCTCVSNTLTLRKKKPQIEDYTPDKSDISIENYKYEPEKIISSTEIPEEVIIRKTPKRPTSLIIVEDEEDEDKSRNKEKIAEAVDTGLKLVKSAVKQGVREGVQEALNSKDFDRYGPGGLRGRSETLQGTVDCQRAGLFRHPTHCNKFYACRWDCTKKKFTLHVFNCPVHLTFDNNLGACNWPSQGPACVDNTLLPSD